MKRDWTFTAEIESVQRLQVLDKFWVCIRWSFLPEQVPKALSMPGLGF